MTTVTSFEQRPDGTVGGPHRAHRPLAAQEEAHVHRHDLVLAAGTWGTQQLLFKMRDTGQAARTVRPARRADPYQLRVDRRCRPLSVTPDLDLTHGVAITSSIHPTSDTHVEPVRYGKGSNAMGLLQTLMTDGRAPTAPMCRAGSSCCAALPRSTRHARVLNRGSGASAR